MILSKTRDAAVLAIKLGCNCTYCGLNGLPDEPSTHVASEGAGEWLTVCAPHARGHSAEQVCVALTD